MPSNSREQNNMTLNSLNRWQDVDRDDWDVLVVGGGIVGAGVARDAAMRGLRVVLVDRHDFAFGTSSRSSRLLHGGLRYLAQGRIGLVHEASREKLTLHQIAAHLADPLPFLFPTYRGTQWARWKLSIGVRIYDLLCGRRNLGPSSTLSVNQMVEKLPGIETRDLTGGVRYYDGLTNDARLVFDTLRSAVRYGAVVRNYSRLESAERSAAWWTCHLVDELTDQATRLSARTIVNATGCWADRFAHSGVKLRLTKGIHVVVDKHRFPTSEAVVMTEGPRILFAIPWGERVILGTTDTDYDGSLEHVPTDSQDISYVLNVANQFFPQLHLEPADVIAHWAGVRPLIAAGKSKKGAPSNTSRNHQIRMPQPGWLDVAGGKLTTYRLMAEQTVARIGKHLALPLPDSRTDHERLLDPAEVDGVSGIIPPPVSRSLVQHYCQHEWAQHLDDVMLRRSSWHYYHSDSHAIAEQVASWMAELLGWDPARVEAEWERLNHAIG
jgi:glycerol-3-phosphate dehydrogenase